MKLSEKDLWCKDLDAFVQEWENQLKEDAEYEKDIRSKGRRASRKIGAGRTTKGRSKKEDEDFNPSKSKAATKSSLLKNITKVEQKPHKGFLEMFQAKPKPKPAPGVALDGADEDEISGMSDDDFAALEAVEPSRQTSRAPSAQPGLSNVRGQRAAAAAPKKWIEEFDEESESDDDKLLGDVGAMVKGIGGGESGRAAPGAGRVSLFAMSRPGTSNGDRPSSSSGLGSGLSSSLPKHTLKKSASRAFDLEDQDETNYEMLASPHKAALPSKNTLDSFLSDDDLPAPTGKPSAKAGAAKAPVKRAPKPKPAPVPKRAASSQPKSKPVALSPAAKAYAAKQSKAQASKHALSGDEDDDVDNDNSPAPRPAARGRPARAAVAKTRKPIYIDSDDDEDVSAVVEDDESEEDDFDDSD